MLQEVSRLKGVTSNEDSPRLQHHSSPQPEGQDSNASETKNGQVISFMGTFFPSLPSSCSQSEGFSDSLSSSRSSISQYFLTEAGKNKTVDKSESGLRKVSFADKEPSASREETLHFMGVLLPSQASSNSESSNLTGPTSHSSSTPKKPIGTARDSIDWFCQDGKSHSSYFKCDSSGRSSREKLSLLSKEVSNLVISYKKRSTTSHLSANILGPGPGRAALRSPSRFKQGIESNTSDAVTAPGSSQHQSLMAAAMSPPLSQQALKAMSEELRRLIPLDEMNRQTSVGSIQHALGQCVPCAYWFKGVCKYGIYCSHCHIIHDGQRSKRLRPSKQTRIRLRRRAANEAGAAGFASDDEHEHQKQGGDSSLVTVTKISF